MTRFWYTWQYKNLTFTALSAVAVWFLFQFEFFHQLLLQLNGYGYITAFVAGMLFASTFTVALGVVLLLVLAEELPVFYLALVAGGGAVLSDLLIFRFVKDHLSDEIKALYQRFGNRHLTKLFASPFFSWTLPVVGAIIIASPLPDEVGVSLMGISRMKAYQFLLISFLLNAVGIFIALSLSFFIQP